MRGLGCRRGWDLGKRVGWADLWCRAKAVLVWVGHRCDCRDVQVFSLRGLCCAVRTQTIRTLRHGLEDMDVFVHCLAVLVFLEDSFNVGGVHGQSWSGLSVRPSSPLFTST